MLQRLRQRRPVGEAGVGLAELVVTMLVGSVVLAALGTVFVGMIKTSAFSRERTASIAEARLGVDTIARRLRVAVAPSSEPSAYVTTTPTVVSFYASLRGATTANPLPTLVTYRYDVTKQCLVEEKTPGVSAGTPAVLTWPTSGKRTTCMIAGDVNALGTVKLFSYYGDGLTATGLPADGAGAVLDKTAIRSVAITATVRAIGTTRPPAAVITRVFQSNLGAP